MENNKDVCSAYPVPTVKEVHNGLKNIYRWMSYNNNYMPLVWNILTNWEPLTRSQAKKVKMIFLAFKYNVECDEMDNNGIIWNTIVNVMHHELHRPRYSLLMELLEIKDKIKNAEHRALFNVFCGFLLYDTLKMDYN